MITGEKEVSQTRVHFLLVNAIIRVALPKIWGIQFARLLL